MRIIPNTGVVHNVRCIPPFFQDVRDKVKLFEVRENDRDYQVGDIINLREWIPSDVSSGDAYYTGRVNFVRVVYVLKPADFSIIPSGYCVMSIDLIGFSEWSYFEEMND